MRNRAVKTGSFNSRATADSPFRHGVLVNTEAGLSPADKSFLSGLLERPLAWVDEQVEAGRPLVLAGLGKEAAQTLLSRLTEANLTASRVSQSRPLAIVFKSALWVGFSSFLLGAGLALTGLLWTTHGSSALVATAMGLGGAVTTGLTALFFALRSRSVLSHARSLWKGQSPPKRHASPSNTDWQDRLYALRRGLPQSALPDLAITDVRVALNELEKALEQADELSQAEHEGLSKKLQEIETLLNDSDTQPIDLQSSLTQLADSARMGREALSEKSPTPL